MSSTKVRRAHKASDGVWADDGGWVPWEDVEQLQDTIMKLRDELRVVKNQLTIAMTLIREDDGF